MFLKLMLQVGWRIILDDEREVAKQIDEVKLATKAGKKIDGFRKGRPDMQNS